MYVPQTLFHNSAFAKEVLGEPLAIKAEQWHVRNSKAKKTSKRDNVAKEAARLENMELAGAPQVMTDLTKSAGNKVWINRVPDRGRSIDNLVRDIKKGMEQVSHPPKGTTASPIEGRWVIMLLIPLQHAIVLCRRAKRG